MVRRTQIWAGVATATLATTLAGSAASARGDLIAYEPFLVGGDRANNEYATGDVRTPNNSGLSGGLGLADGAWTGSTSAYSVAETQHALDNVPYEQGGSIGWSGTGETSGFLRYATRGLKSYAPASTYYLSVAMRRASWSFSLDDSLAGFTSGNTGGGLQGVFMGYEGDRGSTLPSLVIKAGNVSVDPATVGPATADENRAVSGADSTFNRIYQWVVRIDASATGPETITYWVDSDLVTTDWSSEAAATATAKYTGSFTTEALSDLDSINRIGFWSPNGSGPVNYDEFRFGTDLESVTEVAGIPEPGTIGLGIVAGGLLALRRTRRRAATAR